MRSDLDGVGFHKFRHTATMGPYKTSMQVDRQMNRPMEIEAIIGEPLRVAQRHGVQTPMMEFLYRGLKLFEPAKQPIG